MKKEIQTLAGNSGWDERQGNEPIFVHNAKNAKKCYHSN
jgi:hypothetical protein